MPCYDPPWERSPYSFLSNDDPDLKQQVISALKERDEMGNLLCELGKAYEKGDLLFIHPYIEPSLLKPGEKWIAQKFQDWWEKHKVRDAKI